nr:response regulator transcription factor [Ardenticatena sp.]
MKKLRILLVDDHEVVRLGLKALLDRYPQFEVVAEAATADEALARVAQYRPDVVVMDVRLPGKNGIEATREIKAAYPETEVIILTSYAEDELLFDAIRAGASGYVLKQIGSDDLVRALDAVGKGEALLDPKLTRRVFERVRDAEREAEASAFRDLSDQELRVLALLAEGKTNKEIARELYLSSGTVRNYVSSILHKLGLGNRAEAAAYAVQHHIWDYLPD